MKTVEEVRRERLLELKKEFGSFSAINEKLGRIATDSTLSQIANGSIGSKTKKPKTMGSDQARALENALNKTRGWMDTDPELLRAATNVVMTLPLDRDPLERALAALIAAAIPLPPTERKALSEALKLLGEVPDSDELRQRVLAALRRESQNNTEPLRVGNGPRI
ncbi:hypothetical protein [Ottowia sp. VDI28]|uniref:hypothetical protein n=1 Tax=Ottowia sp. VDI28 TaxID=3133968 RepID=UPI003C2E9376